MQCQFGPFRFDAENAQLWQDQHTVALKPKAFAVLQHLLAHAGQLVTKTELLDAIWADAVVTDGVLKFCIRELRSVLGDDAKAPQFIETVHRRGYRFIAALRFAPGEQSSTFKVQRSQPPIPSFVGRETELTQLQGWLEKALNGERQIVFITGEPGIGKTTLVEAFCSSSRATTELLVGVGQCVEQFGVGEAYRPVIEALGRICRESDGQQLISLLHKYAPSWLGQMPSLLSEADQVAHIDSGLVATRGRMLREMAETLEAFAAEQPLVLVLEDLHWSDASTLELLSVVARRSESARLLVIGTYRPADVRVSEHPMQSVQQELQLHDLCEELALNSLSETAIGEYLAVRFPDQVSQFSQDCSVALTARIYQRTDGNPLFVVNIADMLVRRGGPGPELEEEAGEGPMVGLPKNLQRFIEWEVEKLAEGEQQALEAASVVGAEFSVAAAAAGLEQSTEVIEELCEMLAKRGQFLRAEGLAKWPDGTVCTHYRFIHALYQEVLYARIAPGRRIRLHQRIGERIEAAYGEQTTPVAVELAVHFDQGHETQRAVAYYQYAGEHALRRHGYQEAIRHLSRGLELLRGLPQTRECVQQEIAFHLSLGAPLLATKGNGDPEVEANYLHARALCEQIGETEQLFPILGGLITVHCLRAELTRAYTLGEQCLSLAQQKNDPALLLEGSMLLGSILLWRGDLRLARTYLEQGLTLYDRQQHHAHAFVYGQDPGVVCHANTSYTLWLLGYPDQAFKKCRQAYALAQEVSHPYSLGYALDWTAMLHQLCLDGEGVHTWSEAATVLAEKHGFAHLLGVVKVLSGWAQFEQGEQSERQEGIAVMQAGLLAVQSRQAILTQPYVYALLAEALGKTGQLEEGLRCVAEGLDLIEKTGERWWEAELYRVKGELVLEEMKTSQKSKACPEQGRRSKRQMSQAGKAEECFWQAIEIARSQQAKSLELRAVIRLSRVWQTQGKKVEARQVLEECYGWFTEGFGTVDLQQAQSLLVELK